MGSFSPSCHCLTEISSNSDVAVDTSHPSLPRLQASIRGYLYRKRFHEIMTTQKTKVNLTTNQYIEKPKEVGLSYSTDVQESHVTIKRLNKLVPQFKLNEKEQFLLNVESLKSCGLLYPDNSIYKGTINNNSVRDGFGKLYLNDGSIYIGFFKDDKAEGRGRLLNVRGFIYEGDFKNSQAHGYGKLISLDGTIYKGAWEYDKQNGLGEEVYPDGSRYNGEFVDGKKQGKGNYVLPDGNVFEGSFHEDKIHGEGLLKFKDGRMYIGKWNKDKMEGYGVFRWPDEKQYLGQYKDGIKEGFGVFLWKNEREFQGFWKGGKQHGYGIMDYNEGERMEYGEYCNGKLIRIINDDESKSVINKEIQNVKTSKEYIEFINKLDTYEQEFQNKLQMKDNNNNNNNTHNNNN